MANLRVRQGVETRSRLVTHARRLFAKAGFDRTRFDAIGASLGMTSGVMYHHFRNKRELFEEVVRQCHAEIAQAVVRRAEAEPDLMAGILRGCLTFIEEVISPRYIRIVLIDSVAVLGWQTWKEIDAAYSERTLAQALSEARDLGVLAPGIPVGALARFISGGTNELALWVYHQRDRAAALKQAEVVLGHLVGRLGEDLRPRIEHRGATQRRQG